MNQINKLKDIIMKKVLCLTGILLFVITTYAQDCDLNENAQRYYARALAALNDAKSENDYLNAVDELCVIN